MSSQLELVWSDKYSLGHSRIDQQHQELFKLLATLEQALYDYKSTDKVLSALIALTDYSQLHFHEEEQLMERIDYPDMNDHKQQHLAFMVEIAGLMKDIDAGKPVLTIELIQFLKRWLSQHILGADMKIGAFLQQSQTKLNAL